MKKQDIKIGATYMAKITNKIVPVRIDREHTSGGGGWHGTNQITNRPVHIKSAAKLRRKVVDTPKGDTTATGANDKKKAPNAAKGKPIATGANTGKRGVSKPKCKGLPRTKVDTKTGKTIDQATGLPRKKITKAKAAKQMSILDAAVKVLDERDKTDEPLSCSQMIERMQAKNYWSPRQGGKTPDRTLYSAILREINKKGKEARFLKTDRGRFTLVSRKDN